MNNFFAHYYIKYIHIPSTSSNGFEVAFFLRMAQLLPRNQVCLLATSFFIFQCSTPNIVINFGYHSDAETLYRHQVKAHSILF